MAFAAIASKRGAFADMNKAAIDVAQALARLSELTIFELRGEWRRLHRTPPPMRLSRDLLVRGITYKLQERAYGGLSTAAARKLERAATGPPSRGAAKPTQPISLKPGTRLVREWRGVTQMVLIHADGIEWRGQRYRSLSLVARKITGARPVQPREHAEKAVEPFDTSIRERETIAQSGGSQLLAGPQSVADRPRVEIQQGGRARSEILE